MVKSKNKKHGHGHGDGGWPSFSDSTSTSTVTNTNTTPFSFSLPVCFLWNCLIFAIIVSSSISNCQCSKPAGHMRKLGSHRAPLGVTWTGRFSSSFVFYSSFVDADKPVVMKDALKHVNHPGLTNWTDEYLSTKFGDELVKVEESRVEDRDAESLWIPFKEFLNSYQEKDIYLVHSLNENMKELALIPSTLQCGGFQKVIQDSVLWMGSHYASSTLHRDPLDNLFCVLNGRKYVILIDKTYKEDVEADGFSKVGGYSTVDPLEVDFDKFPRLADVNWHEARLEKGDCLFIPQGWYHQVTSTGFRHLSVNIWFSRLQWFNETDCPEDVFRPLKPISTINYASPNEAYRSKLLSLFRNQGILHRNLFRDLLPSNPAQERADEFFNAINKFPDGALSWSELYSFDIDKILPQFWDMFDIPEKPITLRDKQMHGRKNVDNGQSQSVENGAATLDTDDSLLSNNARSSVIESKDADIGESVVRTISEEENDKDAKINLPLPDAVSGDTPSLPDGSIDNPAYQSDAHWNIAEDDIAMDGDDESQTGEFCHDLDCEGKASDGLYQFTESYDNNIHVGDGRQDTSVDAEENQSNQKVLKDEL